MSTPATHESRSSRVRAQLRFLLGDRVWTVVALVLVSLAAGLAESVVITLIAQTAAGLVNHANSVHVAVGPAHLHASVMTLLDVGLALALVRLALMVPLSLLTAQIAANVQSRLRQALLGSFMRASWEAQSRDREGHLQELMTNQVGQASQGALQATQLLSSLLALLVLVLSALLLNVVAALFVLAAAVLLFGLLRPLNELVSRRSRLLSQAHMNFASGVSETTRLAEETHVFGVGDAQRDRVGGLVEATRELFYQVQVAGNLSPNLYRGLIYVFILVGLVVLNLAHAGHVAALGAVVLLLVRAGGYGQAVQGSYLLVRQALPYVERVRTAERAYAESAPATGTRRLRRVHTLAFDRVDFEYTPGRPVLHDISFEVNRGDAIGIVGPSGAGKSTLIQLLLNLRTPQQGVYLINGAPVAAFLGADWHARVAYVPQEPRLLHATVKSNICYFRDVTDAAVERAAKLARIHDDVLAWPNGYDTLIGPRADAISGGQQQRICIARALVAEPEILVLDEPTSALDPQSESLLQESLRELSKTVTLFVIAHRLTTLDMCSRVMVIEGGHLVAFDTAAALRSSSAYYRLASELSLGIGPPTP